MAQTPAGAKRLRDHWRRISGLVYEPAPIPKSATRRFKPVCPPIGFSSRPMAGLNATASGFKTLWTTQGVLKFGGVRERHPSFETSANEMPATGYPFNELVSGDTPHDAVASTKPDIVQDHSRRRKMALKNAGGHFDFKNCHTTRVRGAVPPPLCESVREAPAKWR